MYQKGDKYKLLTLMLCAPLIIGFGFTLPLSAAPLSAEECSDIKVRYEALKTNETVKQMSKGFEWVKANISGEALLPIQQYLKLQEQLRFRCKAKIAAKPTTKKNLKEAKKVRDAKIAAKKKAELNIPVPERKQLSVTEEPEPVKIKIVPLKRKPVKKKKKLKTTEAEPGFFDSFFSEEEETGSTKPKTSKKAKSTAKQPAVSPFFLD